MCNDKVGCRWPHENAMPLKKVPAYLNGKVDILPSSSTDMRSDGLPQLFLCDDLPDRTRSSVGRPGAPRNRSPIAFRYGMASRSSNLRKLVHLALSCLLELYKSLTRSPAAAHPRRPHLSALLLLRIRQDEVFEHSSCGIGRACVRCLHRCRTCYGSPECCLAA